MERIKEEQENKNKSVENVQEKAEAEGEKSNELEPLSGIPNTIMIRKSKRKFLVVSMNTILRDENGCYLGETDVSNIPQTVEVPVKQKASGDSATEEKPVSTKKYVFAKLA